MESIQTIVCIISNYNKIILNKKKKNLIGYYPVLNTLKKYSISDCF